MADREQVRRDARERLRRAVEDGERLYRKRMGDEPTITDDNRIDGILTLDVVDALGFVDGLLAELEQAEQREAALVEALTRVLEWPLPQGSVESYSLPSWLAGEARAALAAHEQAGTQ